MIDFRPVLFLIGILLSILGVFMFIPLVVELGIYKTQHWKIFGISLLITVVIGVAIALANRPQGKILLGMREAFLVTTLAWILLCIFAALPFYYGLYDISFISCCFESVSSLTTTGSTILKKLDSLPRGIILWRSMLQWLGGTGIILMALTIFPALRIGGMQLFRSEFSDRSEKILPRVSQIASSILAAYTFFTVICCVFLLWAGMDFFDAINHSMTTLSTGGFSTKDSSIGFYNNVSIEIIITFFMIIGGSTLTLFVRLWHGDFKVLKRDIQLQTYLLVICISVAILCIWLWLVYGTSFIASLRNASFTVVSLLTTTGFTKGDFTQWGYFPQFMLLLVGLIGGCTGSTTGGIKVFRIQVLFHLARAHLLQLRRPHGVYVAMYQDQKISNIIAISVFTFLTLYVITIFILSAILAALGLDLVTSISGAASAIANMGPALGHVIGGPNFIHTGIPESAKLVLMIGMILGRLELLTIIVLFMPSFWRD